MFERFDARAHPDKANNESGVMTDHQQEIDQAHQEHRKPSVDDLLAALRNHNLTNPAVELILKGETPDRILDTPAQLVCPICESPSCMGKIPDVSCETTDTDDGSWMSYVRDPRRHLIRV